MRYISYFLSLIFIAALFSCSKDSEVEEEFRYNQDNLLGKYALKSYEKKEVFTEEIRGFTVVTKIESKGDTFDMHYSFDSNDKVTLNGTYRITERVTQNDQVKDSAYIVVKNQEAESYAVRSSLRELDISQITYEVTDFSRQGFKIYHRDSKVVDDVRIETTIEAEFKR